MRKFLTLAVSFLTFFSILTVQSNACMILWHETKVPEHLLED